MIEHGHLVPRDGFGVLGFDAGREPVALLRRQPARLGGLVGEIAQHDEAEQHGGQTLDEEHPLPPLQAQVTVEA
jgi:hypothetical protein